jgi:hypothetical protein
MRQFNNGRPFHGSEEVMGGKLKGSTDTDYFYFFCPKCGDTNVLQVLDYRVIREGPVEQHMQNRPKAKKDFTIAFELWCQKCELHDFVKISNIGWAEGQLKDSWSL